MRTTQDKLVLALLTRGEREIKRLNGCIVISRKDGGQYYVGKHGSLRQGKTRAISVPVTTMFKDQLLDEERNIKP